MEPYGLYRSKHSERVVDAGSWPEVAVSSVQADQPRMSALALGRSTPSSGTVTSGA